MPITLQNFLGVDWNVNYYARRKWGVSQKAIKALVRLSLDIRNVSLKRRELLINCAEAVRFSILHFALGVCAAQLHDVVTSL